MNEELQQQDTPVARQAWQYARQHPRIVAGALAGIVAIAVIGRTVRTPPPSAVVDAQVVGEVSSVEELSAEEAALRRAAYINQSVEQSRNEANLLAIAELESYLARRSAKYETWAIGRAQETGSDRDSVLTRSLEDNATALTIAQENGDARQYLYHLNEAIAILSVLSGDGAATVTLDLGVRGGGAGARPQVFAAAVEQSANALVAARAADLDLQRTAASELRDAATPDTIPTEWGVQQ